MVARWWILAGAALVLGACADAGGASEGEVETHAAESETGEPGETSETGETGETGDTNDTSDDRLPDLPSTDPDPLLVEAAGFVELLAHEYELGLGDAAIWQSATPARQFWAFQPAEVAPAEAPVFVFFNGGPGVSSGMLLGLSTGRASFAPALTGPNAVLVDNPHSWTALGNLLWIDARQTGFSYGLLDDPSDTQARAAAMSVANFNTYRDAADFVHTLLEFLAEHPSLRDNPIVLVGESYGGTRAQLMLDMLLHAPAYADGTRHLRDPALVATIQAHHDAVAGPHAGPAQIAAQFGRQILIQPSITGHTSRISAGVLFEQPGSVIHALAAELGVAYLSCAELGGPCNPYDNALEFVSAQNRSPYDYRAPYSWLTTLFTLVDARLNDSYTTETLLGVSAATIVGLAASERVGAWRALNLANFASDAASGDWPELSGELEPWDRYFVSFHSEVLARFRSHTARQLDVDPDDPHFGEVFLANLIWVDTLITDAAYDLAVYTPAIASALAGYGALVSAVIVDDEGREWLIEYAPALDVGSRIVSVPRYEASHAVTLDAPGLLREDVAVWLGGS